eukprot:10089828-Heterocapsa_arctica.AAC.1
MSAEPKWCPCMFNSMTTNCAGLHGWASPEGQERQYIVSSKGIFYKFGVLEEADTISKIAKFQKVLL